MGLRSGFGVGARRRNFGQGLLLCTWRRVPAQRDLGGWGAPGHRSGIGGLYELLCGEGTLFCRETIERSLL
jgi:hypothetical protein